MQYKWSYISLQNKPLQNIRFTLSSIFIIVMELQSSHELCIDIHNVNAMFMKTPIKNSETEVAGNNFMAINGHLKAVFE